MSFMGADTARTKGLFTLSSDSRHTELEALFHKLMAENGPSLFRLAGGFTNSSADRDDLFQEMALAIWQALPNFRGESSARTYLFRIARNRGITYLVSRPAIQAVEGEEPALADWRPDPERQVQTEERRERLLNAIRRLPFAYRDVITLALEGLSYAEMAEILGLSETNVGARLNRAKAVLKELLEKKK